jgi:hypothetical protein
LTATSGPAGRSARPAGRTKAKPAAKAPAHPKSRQARSAAKRDAQLAKMRAKSGNRWRIHYDVDGPRIRLGLLWFVGAMIALALGAVGVVLYFGLAFAAAAAHALRTWRARGHRVDPRVALVGTAAVAASAAFGPQAMGVAVLVLALAVVGLAARGADERTSALGIAGVVLQTTLPAAVAGGCLVLLADLELWAAIALVVLASAYETGDYVVGSGAANAVEGPVAGAAAVLVVALVVAAIGVPPFGVGEAMAFGIAVAPLAFLGQLVGSAMLPHSRSFAPALRRVDSLLLAAPLWYVGVDRIVL